MVEIYENFWGMNIAVFQYFPGGREGGDIFDVHNNREKSGYVIIDFKGKRYPKILPELFKRIKRRFDKPGRELSEFLSYVNRMTIDIAERYKRESRRILIDEFKQEYGIRFNLHTNEPESDDYLYFQMSQFQKEMKTFGKQLKAIDNMDPDFVAVSMILWNENGAIKYATAGQDTGFFYDYSEDKLIDLLELGQNPIGGFIGVIPETEYNQLNFNIENRDKLFIFSDGVEAIRKGFRNRHYTKEDLFTFCHDVRKYDPETIVRAYSKMVFRINQDYRKSIMKKKEPVQSDEKTAIQDDITFSVLEFVG